MPGRILVVDDEPGMGAMVKDDLAGRGYEPFVCTSAEDAFVRIRENDFNVVLTDLRMPGMDGIDLCDRIVENYPNVPVVVMTGFGSMETAITALRAGAYDFVTKPIDMDMLAFTLERAVNHNTLQEKVRVLSERVAQSGRFEAMLGESIPMQQIFDLISRIADSDASVLIMGESGTGKELVAQALHRQSRRRGAPFVAINCAALPDALLESELFGHVKGAFTDANADRKGLILEADGGTLFLDELGALPGALQPKLLRVLEDRRVRAVGSDKEVPFDVRIVAATNSDLESVVERGQFREDLFFRINVIQLEVPPLRSRGADILLLAQHFLQEFAMRSGESAKELSTSVADKLLSYDWPGNVRELRNAIEHASVLARHGQLIVDDLPKNIRAYTSTQLTVGSSNPNELVSMEEMERRYILHVVQTVAGNRTLAARILGLDRKTLYRKLRQYSESPG